jgi:hypothetical protein
MEYNALLFALLAHIATITARPVDSADPPDQAITICNNAGYSNCQTVIMRWPEPACVNLAANKAYRSVGSMLGNKFMDCKVCTTGDCTGTSVSVDAGKLGPEGAVCARIYTNEGIKDFGALGMRAESVGCMYRKGGTESFKPN